MAINEILLKRIGRELREWIYLGIRTGMRQGVKDYYMLKMVDASASQSALERAVDLPRRARTRINTAITKYGQQIFIDALQFNGSTTLLDLNTELSLLEAYAQNLYDRCIKDNESLDSLAIDIETNIAEEINEWKFPLPEDYRDIWGK